jgi:hypothetical protein
MAYVADSGCPDRAEFAARIHARAPRVDVIDDDGGTCDFSVTIHGGPGGAVGRLELRGRDGTTTVREVRGDSCEAVASAQALTAALTLDAVAFASDDATSAPSEAVMKSAIGPSPSVGSDSVPTITAPIEPIEPSADRLRWAVGAQAGFVAAILPGLSTEASAFVEATRINAHWPVSIRLYVARMFPRDHGYEWGHASVDSTLAGFEICPVRWRVPQARVDLRPCAAIDVGSLAASGGITETGGQAGSDRRVFADGMLGGRAEWALGSNFRLELAGGAVVPFTRYTFTLATPHANGTAVDAEFYSVPAVTARASLGVAMQFR